MISWFKCLNCNIKVDTDIEDARPSVEERIAMMDEVRELRLKPNKTPEQCRRQRELTAKLNDLALPV